MTYEDIDAPSGAVVLLKFEKIVGRQGRRLMKDDLLDFLVLVFNHFLARFETDLGPKNSSRITGLSQIRPHQYSGIYILMKNDGNSSIFSIQISVMFSF